RSARVSAFRLRGFEIASVRTAPSSRQSTRGSASTPLTTSLDDQEDVALVHRLAFLGLDLEHLAVVVGLDGHLHLHGLDDDERVALLDLLPLADRDLPDGAGDVRLDLRRHACVSVRSWGPAVALPDAEDEAAVGAGAFVVARAGVAAGGARDLAGLEVHRLGRERREALLLEEPLRAALEELLDGGHVVLREGDRVLDAARAHERALGLLGVHVAEDARLEQV